MEAEILRELDSGDEELRRQAVERLADTPDAEALAILVERLGDPSWRVRKAAIEGLARRPRPETAVEALVEALADDDNPGRRNAALEALTHCGVAALTALLEASRDPDVDVRKQAVDALAGIGDPSAAGRLRELLRDPDPNVRGAAAEALAAVGCEGCAPQLLEVVAGDGEPLVRLSALRALAQLEVACPVEALQAALDDSLLAPSALALLGLAEDPAAEDRLLKALAEARRAGREAAMDALVRLASRRDDAQLARLAERTAAVVRAQPELVDVALARLERGDLSTRLLVVQFLALAKPPACVLPLLEAGLDEALGEVVLETLVGFGPRAAQEIDGAWERLEPRVRLLGCELLGRMEEGPGLERLRASLGEPDPELRAAAARALARRGGEAALVELVAQLEAVATGEDDTDEDLAGAFAEGILGIATRSAAGGERAKELLVARLQGAGELFRVAAARILGAVGCPGETEPLAILMADPSAPVRRAAVEALARLARGETPELLRLALADESASVRIGAAGALAHTGDPAALEDLAALAGDEDERVRAAAVRALGIWAADAGPGAWGEPLESLLAAGLGEGGPVALAALEALQTMGGAPAVAMARGLLGARDAELVQGALACVAAHGCEDDLAELVPLASHPAWTVRARAVQALAERGFAQALPALRRRREVEGDEFVRDALERALACLDGGAGR